MKRREPKNSYDIRGERFGYLTAIEMVYKKPRYYWLCKCDCGKEKLATYNQLQKSNIKSCGCYRKEFKSKVSIGDKYNKLKVISKTDERSASGSVVYKCLCDCGSEINVNASNLKNGYVISCGCGSRYKTIQTKLRKRNKNFKKLVGQKINEFIVLNVEFSDDKRRATFICECSCGEKITLNEKSIKYTRSCGHLRKGEFHWHYNHELTQEERMKDRYTYIPGIKNWVKEVYRKDRWKCILCGHKDTGRKGEGIVAHHLNSYKGHEEQSVDIDNGVTLCETCHKSFHSEFGYGNNTKQQFEQFKSKKVIT